MEYFFSAKQMRVSVILFRNLPIDRIILLKQRFQTLFWNTFTFFISAHFAAAFFNRVNPLCAECGKHQQWQLFSLRFQPLIASVFFPFVFLLSVTRVLLRWSLSHCHLFIRFRLFQRNVPFMLLWCTCRYISQLRQLPVVLFYSLFVRCRSPCAKHFSDPYIRRQTQQTERSTQRRPNAKYLSIWPTRGSVPVLGR